MSFFEITGPDYLALARRRLEGEEPELEWLQHFRDLLAPDLKEGDRLLDVGCATGYAFRTFEPFGIRYLGIDVEEAFLEIARTWYREESRVELRLHNLAQEPIEDPADFVICSAIIEHLDALQPALGHLADACRRTLLLRTFLGPETEMYSIQSPVAEFAQTHRKSNNQYGFLELTSFLHQQGFRIRIYRDRYTDSIPQLVDGVMRTFYVVRADRVEAPQ